jgi:nudix-type nucleoside diphosphatase (YffH/AdpP family)
MSSDERSRATDRPQTLADGRVAIVERRALWQGFIALWRFVVEVPTFAGGRMRQVREVHDHGSAAVVLPIDPVARTALLVRQWRIPPLLMGKSEPLLEAVAGLIDAGETPEDCARREAIEETGHELRELKKVAACFSSPGTMTEFYHLYIGFYDAASRIEDGGGLAHEEEDLEAVEMGFDDLRALFDAGGIDDAKTYIAVAHVLQHYA